MAEYQYVDPATFKNAEDRTNLALRKQFGGVRKAVDVEQRTVDFVISTAAVDRDGDTIDPAGFQLDAFRQNPVVLFAHDQSQPPVAKAVSIEAGNQALRSQAQFARREVHPFADTVFQLIADGFLNATSVGFIPTDFKFSEDRERGFMAMDITGADLMEFSVVPVPSNPEALIQARSKGIDTSPMELWAEQVLDQKTFDDARVEEAWKAIRSAESYLIGKNPRTKVAPGDAEVGRFYEWDASGGTAQGRADRVITEGSLDVPDSSFSIDASEDDPAVLLTVYQEQRDGFVPTDVQVGHRASELRAIDPLPAPNAEGRDANMQAKARRTARRPEFTGIERRDWSSVGTALEDMLDGYFRNNPTVDRPDEMPDTVEETPRTIRQWIASRTLLGEVDSDTVENLISFPVVNPRTDRLNANALRAAISFAPQSDLSQRTVQSIQSAARGLLSEFFEDDDEAENAAPSGSATKATDFPTQGDDQPIRLSNSQFDEFDRTFAEMVADEYPEIWGAGGTDVADQAFVFWRRARNGSRQQEVLDWIKQREAWAARHFRDGAQFQEENPPDPVLSNIGGVVAQMKWGVVGVLGMDGMKRVINRMIEKREAAENAEAETDGMDEQRAARVRALARRARQRKVLAP